MAESQITLTPSMKLSRILTALTEMACFRMAKIDKEQLALFSRRLAKENLEDVLAAMATIADLPRNEGESAFPEIGVILALTGSMAIARHNRWLTSTAHAYEMWDSMSDSFKADNPWAAPTEQQEISQ